VAAGRRDLNPAYASVLALAALLTGSAMAAPVAKATPDAAAVAARRAELQSRVAVVRRDLAAAETQRVDAADALRASDEAISSIERRLFELRQQRAATAAGLARLDADGAALDRRMRDGQSRLARIVAQQQGAGAAEPLKLILSGRDPASVQRMLHYWRLIGAARAQAIAALAHDRTEVEAMAAQARAQQAELDRLTADEALQKAALVAERTGRARVLERVAADVRRQRRTLASLQRDDARLAALLQELSRITRALPRPAPPAPGRVQPDASPAVGLGARRGLAMPVSGELVGRFGAQRESGIAWKGWFIRCPAGQEVRAIAAGQVVWADWLRGFGNLLILDHGNGYMSLYGFNDALFAAVGTNVREGEVLAQAGASGGAQEPGVYFEIRHDGKAVDPAPWFGR
jgi:septal ring factor EnvC (AmiA/AmiB activator)